MKMYLLLASICIALLQSCGTSSNVTSNFSIQKRKYNKGWNVKELFQHKQNGDAAEVEEKSKNQNKKAELAKTEIIQTEPDQEISNDKFENEVAIGVYQAEQLTTNNPEEIKKLNDNSIQEHSSYEEMKTNEVSSKTHEDPIEANENDEKIPDMLFRIFFIIGFILALLIIILTLLGESMGISLIMLLLLFLVDVASLFIVLALLIKRIKYKGKYKEKGWLVLLTELILGGLSFSALLLCIYRICLLIVNIALQEEIKRQYNSVLSFFLVINFYLRKINKNTKVNRNIAI